MNNGAGRRHLYQTSYASGSEQESGRRRGANFSKAAMIGVPDGI